MFYYFDSSVAVKRYAPEKGSEWVEGVFALNRTLLESGLAALTFSSIDKILCEAARGEGLMVYDPNEP